jgi:hypothetical protein
MVVRGGVRAAPRLLRVTAGAPDGLPRVLADTLRLRVRHFAFRAGKEQHYLQTPRLQTLAPGQRLPQRPQLASSVFVLTQTPLQLVRRVDGQHLATAFSAQSPLHTAQMEPSAHGLPHRPQLASSVVTLVHAPPQVCCPDGQTQLVPVHWPPLGQVVHAPPQQVPNSHPLPSDAFW